MQMADTGTGEYAAAFTATAAGVYSVSVTFQGQHIAGSPFSAEVSHSSNKIFMALISPSEIATAELYQPACDM